MQKYLMAAFFTSLPEVVVNLSYRFEYRVGIIVSVFD